MRVVVVAVVSPAQGGAVRSSTGAEGWMGGRERGGLVC